MSGAEIQANAISTLRHGIPLRKAAAAIDLALIVLLGVLPAVLAITTGPKLAAGLVAAAAVLYLVLVQLLFSAGWIVQVLYPLLCLLLSAIGVFAIRGLGARR